MEITVKEYHTFDSSKYTYISCPILDSTQKKKKKTDFSGSQPRYLAVPVCLCVCIWFMSMFAFIPGTYYFFGWGKGVGSIFKS